MSFRQGARQFFEKRGGAHSEKYILMLKNGMDLRCDAMLPDGDFTISLWYKGYSKGANNEVYQWGWREYPYGWGGSRAVFQRAGLYFRYATGTDSSQWSTGSLSNYAADQQWHHFLYRKSSTNVQVFCDEHEASSKVISTPHRNDGTPLSIGSLGNDSDIQSRRGVKSIGFFCLFGRALTDAEIPMIAAVRELKASGGLFTDLVCGYELSSETELRDVTGQYPLTMHNPQSQTVEYNDLLT